MKILPVLFLVLVIGARATYEIRKRMRRSAARKQAEAARRSAMPLPPATTPPGMLPAKRQNTEHAFPPDPRRPAAAEAARAGEWQPAAKLFAELGDDWNQRATLVYALGRAAAEDDGWLKEWQRARPDDPDATVVEAQGLVRLAWNLRGDRRAKQTGSEQFAGFHRVLPQAREACHRAAVLALPGDPTPYAVEFSVALGTGYPHEQARALFAEIVSRDPHHQSGHTAALQYWCEKWCGSQESADAFAREAAASAAPGACLSRLPLISRLEHRPYFKAAPDDHSPELSALLDAALADAAAAPEDSAQLRELRHLLAYYLFRNGRPAEALTQFRLTDGWIGALPWSYSSAPQKAYARIRHDAFTATRPS
jgi:hypothetical protein